MIPTYGSRAKPLLVGSIQFSVNGLEYEAKGRGTDLLDKLKVHNRLDAGFVRGCVLVADEAETTTARRARDV